MASGYNKSDDKVIHSIGEFLLEIGDKTLRFRCDIMSYNGGEKKVAFVTVFERNDGSLVEGPCKRMNADIAAGFAPLLVEAAEWLKKDAKKGDKDKEKGEPKKKAKTIKRKTETSLEE